MADRTWKIDYFLFQGRLARLQFLKRMIVIVALWVVVILAIVLLLMVFPPGLNLIILIAIPAWAAMAWSTLSLQARRLHDIDLSGWWLLAYIPLGLFQRTLESFGTSGGAILSGLVGLAATLFIFAYPGTPGPNRFGPPRRTDWRKHRPVAS